VKNYKLILQYDGGAYAGWQIQKSGKTIQQEITNAIELILKEKVNLIGSGRTDAGVHALKQTANFKTGQEIDVYRFKHSLNSMLPKDIAVNSMNEVDESFHARYDAKRRSYIYLISKFKSPFYNRYSFFHPQKIDVSYLNEISKKLIRTSNFNSFCKTISSTENKICTIYNCSWRETKDLIIFFIEADRFLHGMVRSITGTLITLAKNNSSINKLDEIIEAKDRKAAGEAVPAKGLFLLKVKY
jgi:tRNA pseudouridine38-40 synthase